MYILIILCVGEGDLMHKPTICTLFVSAMVRTRVACLSLSDTIPFLFRSHNFSGLGDVVETKTDVLNPTTLTDSQQVYFKHLLRTYLGFTCKLTLVWSRRACSLRDVAL
jgi:hypothetical protein